MGFMDIIDTLNGFVWGMPLIALILLSKRFFELMKDYKARYMGIGEVDPDFIVWYEDRKKLAAK